MRRLVYKARGKDILKNPPQDVSMKAPDFDQRLKALMEECGIDRVEAALVEVPE